MKAERKRIICIDDDKSILDVNKRLLEATGTYQVECFTGGAEGLKRIKEQKPDLVLLDMIMPGMDGLAVLKVLKSDPDIKSVPVIFMTAQKAATDVKKYMDLGALSVITKPIDIEDFPHQMQMLSKIIL